MTMPTLVYDGDCGLCASSARLAKRHLDTVNVASWQSADLDVLGLDPAQCRRAIQWVDVSGRRVSAERAIIAAMRHSGGGLGAVGAACNLPGVRQLLGIAYRIVAANRTKLCRG